MGDIDNGLFLPGKATNMEQSQFKDEDMKTANSKIAVVGLGTQDTRYLNMAHALQSLVFALQLSVLLDTKSLKIETSV